MTVIAFTVASRNNDRTVGGKAFAWRLLGMMPSISKAATVSQTDEWRAERRTRLYHSCIDILVQQINELTGRDVFLRFGDQQFRRSRVFLDFLSMDGDEVSHATMCPTVQCLMKTYKLFNFKNPVRQARRDSQQVSLRTNG